MPQWIREGELAVAARPGYAPGAEFSVRRHAVDAWVAEAREFGVASIICLLAGDQLPLYDRALPEGLIRHYEAEGFAVTHIPTADEQRTPFTPEQLDAAWRAYQTLPKPVLVHCSAGYDRTGHVVRHIVGRLVEQE